MAAAHRKLEELYRLNPKLQNEQREHAPRHAPYAEYEAIEQTVNHHVVSDSIAEEERKFIINLIEQQQEGH